MARKYEFKPDRLNTGWISKLYLTQAQRKTMLKWFLIGLMLTVVSVLQDVVLCRIRLYGATTAMVPCAIFLIAVMEGAERGSVFALVASFVYQFSGSAPGMYAMVLLTGFAVAASIFRQSYLQKSFGSDLLCTALAMVAYELAVFCVGYLLGLTILSRLPGFLLTAVMSVICAPVLYPIVRATESIGGKSWIE